MEAPEKIYLQVCGDCPQTDCDDCKFGDLEDNITWCKERIFHKDVEYAFIEKVANLLKYRLHDRVEVAVPGTLIESVMGKEEFIEEFVKEIKRQCV